MGRVMVIVTCNDKMLRIIQKACRRKKHVKLTVGYVTEENMVIKMYDETGEINANENIQYEIGSITKTFTTSLLAKYIYENKLSLDDTIEQYIGGLTATQYYPTIKRLATHTAGYSLALPLSKREYIKILLGLITGGGTINKENPIVMDVPKMMKLLKQHNVKNKDYTWQYSNFGLSLIGYILGVVSGDGYRDAMNDFLTRELQLKDTYVGISKRNLHGYDKKNRDCGNWQWDEYNVASPAGAISSTARDLLTYAKMNMHETKDYLSLCHEKHARGRGKLDMGLGWFMLKKNNEVIWHAGGTGCFSSFLGIDKEKKVATVVLANYRLGMNAESKIGFSLLEYL